MAGSIAAWIRLPSASSRWPPSSMPRGTSCSRDPTTRCERRPSGSRPRRSCSCPSSSSAGSRSAAGVPPQAWASASLSGGVEVLYFAFLAAAFRRGDLSVVYPLARGTAPLLAIAIGIGILGERLVPGGVARGRAAARRAAARPAAVAPAPVGGERRTTGRRPGSRCSPGATIATTRPSTPSGVSLTPVWVYAAHPVADVHGRRWPSLSSPGRRVGGGRYRPAGGAVDRRTAIAGGFLTFSAYALVLAALSRAPLAVVAPLRESAIVLTSLWGVAAARARRRGRREVRSGSRLGARARRGRGARARALMQTIGGHAAHGPPGTAPDPRLQGLRRAVPPAPTCSISPSRRAGRLRLRLDQRPLPALAPHGRPCAELVHLARRARRSATERVKLGTSVVTPTFRYNPAIVAQAIATLSCLAEAGSSWASAPASR